VSLQADSRRADSPVGIVLKLPDLLAPIAQDMTHVDAVIRERLNSEVVLIRTIGDYIVGAGGKRMRVRRWC